MENSSVDSIISYQIQNEEKKIHIMKRLKHNILMSECNILRQTAVAPTPSVCFK
jgi:hypothetical protein